MRCFEKHLLLGVTGRGPALCASLDQSATQQKVSETLRHIGLLVEDEVGHALVIVPYWEWNGCRGTGERVQYLRGKLELMPKERHTTSVCQRLHVFDRLHTLLPFQTAPQKELMELPQLGRPETRRLAQGCQSLGTRIHRLLSAGARRMENTQASHSVFATFCTLNVPARAPARPSSSHIIPARGGRALAPLSHPPTLCLP